MRFDGDHDALYRIDSNGHLREALRWTIIRDQAQLLAATPQGDLLLDSDAGGNFRRVLRLDRDNVLHFKPRPPAPPPWRRRPRARPAATTSRWPAA